MRDAKPLFALLVGVILFLFGIAIGYMVGGKTSAVPGGRGYDEGFAAAKAELQSRLEAAGLALPEEQLMQLESQLIYNFSGTLLEMSNDEIRVRATFPSFDFLTEARTVEMTARVTDQTKIVRRKELTPEEFDEVFRKFNEEQQ
ncbi:MAG TPA: hypothetical protein VI565_05505, partial [Burkholderiales bacterium]|nr:hypothetical protein [Burkholderiales bacterium]